MSNDGNNLPEYLLGQISNLPGLAVFAAVTAAASAAITGTVLATFSTNVPIPANTLAVNDQIEVTYAVDILTVAGSPTFRADLLAGGATAIQGVLAGVGSASFVVVRALGVVTAIGAGTTAITWMGTSGAAQDSRATAALDSTAAIVIAGAGAFNNKSASNTAGMVRMAVKVTRANP